MTTGATGQLGLALPVQGELSGTWGDTVNNGITQYTNIAIAGTLTLTGDGAVTLANTTGDASASNITSTLTGAGTVTAQFAIVKVTGTLTTAKVVTGPSYSKTYTVVNSATGGAVTFKASGQTGVSIAVGETAFVYYNGTDYVKVVGTATAGAAGGSNTQVQYNSSGVLAGSANLTFNGTTLTANTLNLTNALGIAYGGTGQITANAAFNALAPSQTGNSGKYLTTNGTDTSWATNPLGTVTSVDVSGGTTGLTTSGGPITTSGTITLAGTLATTNGGTGLTSFTSGGVVYASSTSALTTGSALQFTGTNLGLGTTNPDVFSRGDARILGIASTGNAAVAVNAASGSSSYLQLGSNGVRDFQIQATSSAVTLGTGASGANPIIFALGFNEYMRLNSTGLGIGTSSPQQKLVVSNNGAEGLEISPTAIASGSSLVSYNRSGAAYTQLTASALRHVWQLSGTEGMRFDSTGLGIGTNAPTTSLSVVNATSGFKAEFVQNTTTTGDYTGISFAVSSSSATGFKKGALFFERTGAAGVGKLHLANNATADSTNVSLADAKLTIDSSGNVGIGTTSPYTKLQVTGTIKVATGNAQGILSLGDGNGSTVNCGVWRGAANAPTTDGNYLNFGGYDGIVFATGAAAIGSQTERARIDSSGNVGIGTSSPVDNGAGYKTLTINSTTSGVLEIQNNGTSRGQLFSDASNFIFNAKSASTGYKWNLAGTTSMVLDSAGNLGLGVTPSAWYSGWKAFEMGSGSLIYPNNGSNILLACNAYNNTSGNWLFKNSGGASFYSQNGGQHIWYYTSSTQGAGNTISWTAGMTLDASGNLIVGGTSALSSAANRGNITVNGTDSVLAFGNSAVSAGYIYVGSSNMEISAASTRYINFNTNGSERARIDSSGNLLVGTTATAAAKVTIVSTTNPALTLPNIAEIATVSATAATGTINYDLTTQSVLYYTTNASGNFTMNIRGNSGLSLNSMMSTGQSVTMAFLCTNGATAYYQSAMTIDGSSVTPKWQGGTAPTTGNASAIDSYVYTIIKTASATFTVLASQTKFA